MADLPIKELGDEAPIYDRKFEPSPKLPPIDAFRAIPAEERAAKIEALVKPILLSASSS